MWLYYSGARAISFLLLPVQRYTPQQFTNNHPFQAREQEPAMMPTDLDRYDLKILAALQENAAISNQELADRIGLSPSPCSRRVKQLEEAGYILRQVALLDPHKLGLTLTAFVMVGMDRHTPDRFAHFEDTIR